VFTFIESSVFQRMLPQYLDDDEYSDLQQFLMQNPEAGLGREWGSEGGFGASMLSDTGPTSFGC